MIRDPGPRYNLGFGIPLDKGYQSEEGLPAGSSAVQKMLYGHPVAGFLSTAAATMIGMHVAGKVVREGGLRLTMKLQEAAKGTSGIAPMAERMIKSVRDVREVLDELQGVHRMNVDENDPLALVVKNADGKYVTDHVEEVDNFQSRYQRILSGEDVDLFATRDRIQQKLISQARRLPYELPALYAADKVVTPIFDKNPDKQKVNWHNPIDVLGDFAFTSVKNLAFNVLPFEAAGGAMGNSYKKMMSQSDLFMNGMGGNFSNSTSMLSLRTLLAKVGADAGDLFNKSAKFSHQTAGAAATFVHDSMTHSTGVIEGVKLLNSQVPKGSHTPSPVSGFPRRLFNVGKHATTTPQGLTTVANTLPGPFKGIGSAVASAKRSFTKAGEAYDDWQSIVSGKSSFKAFKDAGTKSGALQEDVDRLLNLQDFMKRGGQTRVEEFADQIYSWGRGGRNVPGIKGENPQWRDGLFYQARSRERYQKLLTRQLEDRGMDKEVAGKFVNGMTVVRPFSTGLDTIPGGKLLERFNIVGSEYAGRPSSVDWWNEHILKNAKSKGVDLGGFGYDDFKLAVTKADGVYGSRSYKKMMDSQISDEWDSIHGSVLPRFGGNILTTNRRPYEEFSGSLSSSQKDFLLRRTAQRMGIDVVDGSGRKVADSVIRQEVAKRGIDPTKSHLLKAYLINKKDIANPWSFSNSNLFGFTPMTVREAWEKDYFAHNTYGVRNEIAHIVNSSRFGYDIPDTAKALRMKGVYKSSSGAVLDVGRLTRSIGKTMDVVAEEFQIPLLHIRPFNLMGHGAEKSLRQKAMIQYMSGSANNAFLEKTAPQDFYLWMKTSRRGSKGKVVGINPNIATGKAAVTELGGFYKPFSTDPYSMLGRTVRMAIGDMGIPKSSQQPDNWKGRFKKAFDVSYDQSESISGLAKRWTDSLFRRGDDYLRNEKRFAGAILNGKARGSLSESGVEGFANLHGKTRATRISPKLIQRLSDDPAVADALKISGRPIKDIPDSLLPEHIEKALDDHIRLASSPDSARDIRRSQQNIRNLLKESRKQNEFFSDTTTDSLRSVGINRRIDELRNETYKYFLLNTSRGSTQADFNTTIQNVLNIVDNSVISSMEKAEARAAILGMQIEYLNSQSYNEMTKALKLMHGPDVALGVSKKQIAEETIAKLMDTNGLGDVNAKILRDFASGKSDHFTGKSSFIKRGLKNVFTTAKYKEPPTWNPFNSDVTFVPTFGTAFARNPLRAVGSVAGVNTYSDPQAFSGSSVMSSHFISRLNRYFETFNLGIDQTNYKGPLDLFARGMVGKRVFPLVVAGSTATMVDRQLGGMVKEDENGDPIYSPLFMGMGADAIAAGQIGLAGLIPGGQTAKDKRYELKEGEVPIRQGRFWPLGNTPFKGGRIQYYRPSWYQRFKSGAAFMPEKKETPMERLAFGYDFSPLRPLDPYRFERQNYESRPYPVTGDYFSGPWGPVTGMLNATVGKVLKPRKLMHKEEMAYGLQQYLPVGESGAYMSTTPVNGIPPRYSSIAVGNQISATNNGYASAAGAPGGQVGSGQMFYGNMGVSSGRGLGSTLSRQQATLLAAEYAQAAQVPGSFVDTWRTLAPYGVPTPPGQMQQRVVASRQPISPGSTGFQASRVGYQSQEMLGIYGFLGASLRETFGLGNKDISPNKPVLEPANRGYSASRSFWGMNLGGLGDLPMPLEGSFANLEISEIVRRFVPKEPTDINYVNPLPNAMGKQYPWLPGMNYPLSPLKMGDPYRIPDAEIRLPGTGYARTHQLFPDEYGKIGLANIHDILADVAPWSAEYRAANALVADAPMTDVARAKVEQTRAQLENMRMKREFSAYEYKYRDPLAVVEHPIKESLGRSWEWLAHRDTIFNTKFLNERTALEDWERTSVYGATFPTWDQPIDSFMKPMVNKATQRDPFIAALGLGATGYFFGVSPASKRVGSIIGGATGMGISAYRMAHEKLTGERFIPKDRKKELALEEYTDILSYTRSAMFATKAQEAGDTAAAQYFANQTKKTMYGADLNATPEEIALAVPKRKREHFRSMLYAPPEEREKILSTAGRLERRIYQAAWGLQVEKRPDIQEYFTEHELPAPESEVWSPLVNMDTVKIKMGQSMGLDMAQMGFYPQQINEANLINPGYPSYSASSSLESVNAQLRRLLYNKGIAGNVRAIPTPYSGTRVELMSGVG